MHVAGHRILAGGLTPDNVAEAIRISFDPALGAWSYVGTDCRGIPFNQATMNLGFMGKGNASQPAALHHEPGNHPVEGQPVEVLLLGQEDEAVDRLRRLLRQQLDAPGELRFAELPGKRKNPRDVPLFETRRSLAAFAARSSSD